MTDPPVGLEARAERLRAEHLAAHDIPNALPWRALQDYEQSMWLDRARAQDGADSNQEVPR